MAAARNLYLVMRN